MVIDYYKGVHHKQNTFLRLVSFSLSFLPNHIILYLPPIRVLNFLKYDITVIVTLSYNRRCFFFPFSD